VSTRTPRIAGPLLGLAACWRSPPQPPPLRGELEDPADRPTERTAWRGTCGDEQDGGWQEAIEVTLAIGEEGTDLVATGTLAFAGRKTRARLQGKRARGSRSTLRGEMRELGGLGTRWGLVLEVEPGATTISGRFIEVLDAGGEEEICRFAWSR